MDARAFRNLALGAGLFLLFDSDPPGPRRLNSHQRWWLLSWRVRWHVHNGTKTSSRPRRPSLLSELVRDTKRICFEARLFCISCCHEMQGRNPFRPKPGAHWIFRPGCQQIVLKEIIMGTKPLTCDGKATCGWTCDKKVTCKCEMDAHCKRGTSG